MSFLAASVIFIVETRRRIASERSLLRQAFTHRSITTQEGERKRIAYELHDWPGQHLVLNRTLAMQAIHGVEGISYDLRPHQLDRLGLTKALVSLIQDLEASHSLSVKSSIGWLLSRGSGNKTSIGSFKRLLAMC